MKKRIYRRMPVNDFQPADHFARRPGRQAGLRHRRRQGRHGRGHRRCRRARAAHHLLEGARAEPRRARHPARASAPRASPSRPSWSLPAPTAMCFATSSNRMPSPCSWSAASAPTMPRRSSTACPACTTPRPRPSSPGCMPTASPPACATRTQTAASCARRWPSWISTKSATCSSSIASKAGSLAIGPSCLP